MYTKHLPIFFSLLCFMFVNSLLQLQTPLQMYWSAQPLWEITAVNAAYFGGMFLGVCYLQKLLSQVGYIRAFCAFSALFSSFILLQGITAASFHPWVLWRFGTGLSVAAIITIAENWIVSLSHYSPDLRARTHYIYLQYGAQLIAPLLIPLFPAQHAIHLYLFAMLISACAIIPMAFSVVVTPAHRYTPQWRKAFSLSQTAFLASVSSGMILSALSTLLPLYLLEKDLHLTQVCFGIAALSFGGLLMQEILQRSSESIDRRYLLLANTSALLLAIISVIFSKIPTPLLMGLIALLGGCAFALYPLSLAYLYDRLSNDADRNTATQVAILSYSLGAFLGPLLITVLVAFKGLSALMLFNFGLSLAMFAYLLWRHYIRPKTIVFKSTQYAPITSLPQQGSPLIQASQPAEEEEP